MAQYITANNIEPATLTTLSGPKIQSITYPGNDTAVNVAGGDTVTLTGTGFVSGCTILVNGSAAPSVTFNSSTSVQFTTPALSAGGYVVYLINPDGGTAIAVPGLQYSGVPAWSTAAGTLGTVYETSSINTTVAATGDAPITYTLQSGSLPTGANLNSSTGLISGTSPITANSTTYSFTIRATDGQNQDTDRAFSITINPDVVTWSSPADGTAYSVGVDSAISNVSLVASSAAGNGVQYTANTLPTGLTLTGNVISGTPTVTGNVSTLLTATANVSNRSATRTISWVVNVSGDTNWNYVTTLLSANMAVAPFNDDASTNNFAVTINGDTRPNNFNPYTPGYYSNYFDGNGDYLTVATSASMVASGDFTFAAWVYPTAASPIRGWLFNNAGSGSTASHEIFGVSLSDTLAIGVWYNDFSNIKLGTNSNTVPINRWSYISVVRSGSSVTIYINGVLSSTSTGTRTGNIGSSTVNGTIGAYQVSQYFIGYIADLSWTNDSVITTVPTSPKSSTGTSLLTCQSNRFIDNSTNNFTVTRNGDTRISSFDPFVPNSSYSTYGSTYFDGTGDYLIVNGNSNLALGSGDFTVEGWFYIGTNTSIWRALVIIGNSNDNGIYLSTSNTLTWFESGAQASSATVIPSSWNHFAVSRQGTTLRLFLNGVKSSSDYTTSTNYTRTSVYIGSNGTGGEPYTGYLSDIRVVKGTAVYTSAFTPPTAPLTAIANTSLLTCQTNQPFNNNIFLDNSTNNFLITRAGNTTQGTFSPYGAGWSGNFNGLNSMIDIGFTGVAPTADFTIEMWFYGNSFTAQTGGDTGLTFIGLATDTSGRLNLFVTAAGEIKASMTNNSGTVVINLSSNTGVVNKTTWYHAAFVRNGNNYNIYLNGTSVASTTSATAMTYAQDMLYVGINRPGGSGTSSHPWDGYISNYRYTKSAVYTGNFTPSAVPLQPITNTVLMLLQDSRFVDNSVTRYPVTPTNVTVQRFSPFAGTILPAPAYSAYFDGTGDFLTMPATSPAIFAFGANDFTIETWVYFNDVTTSQNIYESRPDVGDGLYPTIYISSGTIKFYTNGSNRITSSSVVVGQWYHLAVSKNSGTTKMFLNGAQVGSSYADTNTYINGSAYRPCIATYNGSTGYLNGYLSNLRVLNGTGLYTSTFTPPTSPLTAITNTILLTCQSATFVDNSTNAFSIIVNGNSRPTTFTPFTVSYSTKQSYTPEVFGGSMYFDGTGDYLNIASQATLAPGSGNFTLEFWIYLTATPGVLAGIYDNRPASTQGAYIFLYLNSDRTVRLWVSGADRITSSALALNTWYHLAVVKNSGTTTMYLNGVVTGSTYSDSTTYLQNGTLIGASYGGGASVSSYLTGYLCDVRMTIGTAVYASNFVTQNAPLTAVQNSVLLLNGTSASIYDSSGMNAFETVADAKLSTSVVKYGNTSMYFDGTGDYLSIPSSPNLNLGPGNFTIEMWAYKSNTTDTFSLFQKSSSYELKCDAGRWVWQINTGTNVFVTNGNLTQGTWSHVALVRNGATTTLYVNGSSAASGSSSNPTDNTSALLIGTGAVAFNGYISDFRITKGVARYTANFTPPTAAFFKN